MPESKIELTHRLQRDGRWNEASAFRDRVRKERREAGDTRDVAGEKAWEAMAQQFPPLNKKELAARMALLTAAPAEPDATTEGVVQDAQGQPDEEAAGPDVGDFVVEGLPAGTGDVKADLLWAWNHIHAKVAPSDAPSGSAWYLIQWGRSEKTRDRFVALALKTFNQTADGHDRLRDDRSRQFELLKNLRIEFDDI